MRVGVGTSWTMISADYAHVLGVMSDGSLWSWGRNDHGQLGLGDTEGRLASTLVGPK